MIYNLSYFVTLPYYNLNSVTYLQVVNCLFSNIRKPLSVQKNRGALSYSNKKLSKQKGTGCARHGSRSSPTMRGGGRAFPGSSLRNYNKKINKRVLSLFVKSMLYKKFNYGNIYIYNNSLLPNSTRLLSSLLSLVSLHDKVLVINNNNNDIMSRYSKNIPNIYIIGFLNFSYLDLVNFNFFLISKDCYLRFLSVHLRNEVYII
ncbi:50S ribosomal protein L4 [Candidatus Vidania fulgoroideorum]